MTPSPFARDFLRLFFGPIVWALHFLSIYAITGVLCARPHLLAHWLGFPLTSWSVLAAGLVAAAGIAGVLLVQRGSGSRGDEGFREQVARGLGWLALLAIAWETSAAFLVPGCVPST